MADTRLYLICSFVSIGGLMYGYDTAVLTACLALPEYRRVFSLNSDANGTAAVVVSLAASFFTSLVSGFAADGIGRKKFFYVAAIFHIIGSIIQIADLQLTALLVGRVITGSTVGMLSMSVPLYQSEIASPQNRGRIITLYQLGVTLGFCISSWIAYGTADLINNLSWRVPVGIQIVPGGVLLLGLSLIPESPRWLIARDRYNEALSILAQIRGNKTDDTEIQMEYTSIVQDVTFDRTFTSRKFCALFKTGIENYRKRTVLGAGIHIFTQLTGANALLFYLPRILRSAGLAEVHAVLIGNGVAGSVNFLGTLPVFLYVDRWPRRRILVTGAALMAACLFTVAGLMGGYSTMVSPPRIHLNPTSSIDGINIEIHNRGATYGILVLLCVFIALFALTWGPAGWIYPAEIYPQLIRANAMGVTTATSYLFNIIITLVTPILFETIRWGTYVLFAGFCVVMALVIHKFFPETCGRSLEEVNLIFSGALVDQQPGAHHPETAAEALSKMQQIQVRDRRKRLAQGGRLTLWDDVRILSSSSDAAIAMEQADLEKR
ncbi:general substrate transporter [Zychaea mexicana]|uniref:general substrate transporter n=1 Tax=Zychaea mexicana TaxID=64656 RepID=UPI0022FE2FAA|nr:general substrate transporter [Zychaea mexicana]KAI9497709.1 general substrate transporter [Zychaea mexicana]